MRAAQAAQVMPSTSSSTTFITPDFTSRGDEISPQLAQTLRMETPLQITWRGLGRSPAIETAIFDATKKLEKVHRRIVSCRVVVEQPDHHKRHGRQFGVRLDVRVPGAEVAIDFERDEDVYVALRDAFADARRKLAERRKARVARNKARRARAARAA